MVASKYVLTFINRSDENLTDAKVQQLILKIVAHIPSDIQTDFTTLKRLGDRAVDQYMTTSEPIDKDMLQGVSHHVDLILQHDDEYRQDKKLFVFDMDSTLIYQEVIELIASYAKVEPQVKAITDRAMNNEIDFKESLRERVSLLKGLTIDTIYEEVKGKLQITKGVPELCKFLHTKGIKLAVLSGGFVPFAQYIQEQLGLDYMKANVLETDSEGKLTGKVTGEIVDGEIKAETILTLADKWSIPLETIMMVGDGGNDLPAMGVAGFGIAWNAKPKVQAEAPCQLNTNSLLDALYILGYTDEEINHHLL
ncbi:hypothetical protein MOUN0_C01706 [Monosporozyma unispora]|nr:Phosphoserine phosphatase [Kazachstania unispora]